MACLARYTGRSLEARPSVSKKTHRDSEETAPVEKRERDFDPGERVAFLPDGTTGTIRVSIGGYSHVIWDDEKELGGSRVANSNLRRVRDGSGGH
jgi:hypothetical protein